MSVVPKLYETYSGEMTRRGSEYADYSDNGYWPKVRFSLSICANGRKGESGVHSLLSYLEYLLIFTSQPDVQIIVLRFMTNSTSGNASGGAHVDRP